MSYFNKNGVYPRYFVHKIGFLCGILYLRLDNKNVSTIVDRRGNNITQNCPERAIMDIVDSGYWREVTEEELALLF